MLKSFWVTSIWYRFHSSQRQRTFFFAKYLRPISLEEPGFHMSSRCTSFGKTVFLQFQSLLIKWAAQLCTQETFLIYLFYLIPFFGKVTAIKVPASFCVGPENVKIYVDDLFFSSLLAFARKFCLSIIPYIKVRWWKSLKLLLLNVSSIRRRSSSFYHLWPLLLLLALSTTFLWTIWISVHIMLKAWVLLLNLHLFVSLKS